MGCITDNEDEKYRQELPYPSVRLGDDPRFRVYGHVCASTTGDVTHETLQDFKHIHLVCMVKSAVGPAVFD